MSSESRDPIEGSPGGQPALDRAPGERYRAGSDGSKPVTAGGGGQAARTAARGMGRAAGAALGVGSGGALAVFVLGQVDIGAGLLAVSAAIGWLVALALVWGGAGEPPAGRRRLVLAAGLAAAAILVGFAFDWGWSRIQGGALDPVAYLDQRYGPLAWVDVVVASVAAGLRAR